MDGKEKYWRPAGGCFSLAGVESLDDVGGSPGVVGKGTTCKDIAEVELVGFGSQ